MSRDDWQHGSRTVAEGAQWTPAGGFVRAVLWGVIAACVIAALLGVAAWYLPKLLLIGTLRGAWAFVVTLILFRVVQESAGAVGWPCTLLVVALAALVMASNHVVFAWHGVPTAKGMLLGAIWLHPITIGLMNFSSLIGIGACAVFCHSGVPDFAEMIDWLRWNPRGF